MSSHPHTIERPPKLHELVAKRIQDSIFTGEWTAGSRLAPERELCDRFGVSRTVVRESLKMLTARGLVKQVPGKGAVISANVSEPLKNFVDLFLAKECRNGHFKLFEVRNVLEVEIAGLAAERASAKDIRELERLNDTMVRLQRKRTQWLDADTTEFNDLDFQFHLMLAKCAKNELFVIILKALSDAFLNTWAEMCGRAEVRRHGLRMHARIFAAVRAHDARAARRITRENLKCFLLDASQPS